MKIWLTVSLATNHGFGQLFIAPKGKHQFRTIFGPNFHHFWNPDRIWTEIWTEIRTEIQTEVRTEIQTEIWPEIRTVPDNPPRTGFRTGFQIAYRIRKSKSTNRAK